MEASGQGLKVALGRQLSQCSEVITLGVRGNFFDYTPKERDLIRDASKIYFPTILYAEGLAALGKPLFPSIHCYRHMGDKWKQTLLFQLLQIPMPRTKLYFGRRAAKEILEEFSFPLVAKLPRGGARGEDVFLIRHKDQLEDYLARTHVAYIQQYVPLERDLRVIVLGRRVVYAYWREAAPGEFRTNVARGGRICPDPVPQEALDLGLQVAQRCGFDHVGLDLCEFEGRFLVLEANMAFGREGLRKAGLDYRSLLRGMVESGEI